MAELKVGLAPNRNSFFDPNTNTYITLQAPVQTVKYNENDMDDTVKRLEKIVHALCASVPALVLYEGKLPQECIDSWKAKYMKPFNTDMAKLVRNLKGEIAAPAVKPNRAFDRPEQVNAASAEVESEEVVGASVKEEEVKVKTLKAEVAAEEPEKKEEKKSTRKRTNKADK